ncbi:ATP-binding protein [Erwinia sp. BNK-24-b]|uniref:ATP-binding protein n=1 Tax=unclassified Erwinia TaxID=2622719 RepID=UPI0039BFFBEC
MESVILDNDKLTVEVACEDTQRALFQRLLAFITPGFVVLDAAEQPADLQLALHDQKTFLPEWKRACTADHTIRRSTAEEFNIVLRCGELSDGRQVAWHERDQTGYVWRHGSQQMAMYVGQGSFIHLIEFFRYYLLALEAAKGSLVLHATGVENSATGSIVAICGVKGAGKTSTMLNLTTSGAFHYFSGDKLLVDICDGELRVRSWPDYPHVGAGTLRQHPEFCRKIGLTLNRPPLAGADNRDKFLFAPELFYGALGKSTRRAATLEAVVLPDVLASELSINRLNDGEKSSLEDSRLYEDPFKFLTATWHGLALAQPDAALLTAHQAVRERFRQLNWLLLSGNVAPDVLAAKLTRPQLRLALVASSGSGKSTTAGLLKEAFRQQGLSVSIEKLALPLYNLQRAYYSEMAQTIAENAQHQLLMENIASNLRMLNPRSLIDHLFSRLQKNHADVILTDDLRDRQTDWPALVEQGYVVIHVLCDEKIRHRRLSERHDLQTQVISSLDEDINTIRPDFRLENNGDLTQLSAAVNQLVTQLIGGQNG